MPCIHLVYILAIFPQLNVSPVVYGLYVLRLTSAGSCGFQRRPTPTYNCDPTNCHNKITGTAKQLVLGGLCSSFKSIMLFQCAQIVSITLSESTQDPPINHSIQQHCSDLPADYIHHVVFPLSYSVRTHHWAQGPGTLQQVECCCD